MCLNRFWGFSSSSEQHRRPATLRFHGCQEIAATTLEPNATHTKAMIASIVSWPAIAEALPLGFARTVGSRRSKTERKGLAAWREAVRLYQT